jgi:Tripeptidyl peptidase II
VQIIRRYVYDGVLEAQFIMVHDANKQLLGVADIYPGEQSPPLCYVCDGVKLVTVFREMV